MVEFKGHKLEVKLLCQAPMIHFQHYETGATLRASEVKPKFDKYLIEHVGWEKLKKFKIGTEGKALNYKMRFVDDQKLNPMEVPNIYFGNHSRNNGEERKKEIKMLVKSNPTLIITCFNEELRKFILDHLENFFLVTNFGTMQSKGFGSFIVEGEDIDHKQLNTFFTKKFESPNVYYMDVTDYHDNFQKIFGFIKDFYTLTKSGINGKEDKSPYSRSSLFLYMHTNKIDNEKAEVKQRRIIEPKKNATFHKPQNNNPKYVRALLGLGIGMTFRYENRIQKVNINYEKRGQIDRMASPIFFKIIGDRVYILCKKIPDKIYKKKFIFRNKQVNKSLSLCTPKKEEFSLAKFLDFAVERYNNNQNDNEISKSYRPNLFDDIIRIQKFNEQEGGVDK